MLTPFFDAFEFPLEFGDAAVEQATVGLQLFFTRTTARADTTFDSLKVRPQSFQSRTKIEKLRQLHLQLGFVGAGIGGEDVENQFAAINNDRAALLFDVAPLRRREVVVEDHHFRAAAGDKLGQFFQLAGPQATSGMRSFPKLHQLADDIDASRFDQPPQFIKGMLFIEMAVGGNHSGQNGFSLLNLQFFAFGICQGVVLPPKLMKDKSADCGRLQFYAHPLRGATGQCCRPTKR